jgi:hypothetical protein
LKGWKNKGDKSNMEDPLGREQMILKRDCRKEFGA